MSTATYPETVTLLERASLGASNVDEKSGVISNVKILGIVSLNNRQYLPEALRSAKHLYEGIGVFIDHHGRSNTSGDRSYRDKIGTLRNVRFVENELRSNLHINLEHAAAKQLLWDARNNPVAVGLSHNAEGRIVKRGGKNIVEEITRVRSVDLVTNPATTSGLFESEATMYSMSTSEFAAALIEQDGLPVADVPPIDNQADDLDGDRELLSLQKAILTAVESAKSAADLTERLRSILDARGPSAGGAAESCLPRDAAEFASQLTEGESGYRRNADREMPRDAREFVNALID